MPKKILITYANHIYLDSRKKLIASSKKFSDFDEYHAFAPWDLDIEFRNKNHAILKQQRGDGYWLWKPYIIDKILTQMDEGDILFYADAGCYFIKPAKILIDVFTISSLPIMTFELEHAEKHWTKKDCFIAINHKCLHPKQRQACYHLWRKNKVSEKIVKEWLHYAQDPQLITDLPSKHPNYTGFIEHRHDQSIFSLLTKKHNIPVFRDPSQYGNEFINQYKNSPYKQIIRSTRKKSSLKKPIFKSPFMWKCANFYKKHYGYDITNLTY